MHLPHGHPSGAMAGLHVPLHDYANPLTCQAHQPSTFSYIESVHEGLDWRREKAAQPKPEHYFPHYFPHYFLHYFFGPQENCSWPPRRFQDPPKMGPKLELEKFNLEPPSWAPCWGGVLKPQGCAGQFFGGPSCPPSWHPLPPKKLAAV